jgi:uncharacterized membrane protein
VIIIVIVIVIVLVGIVAFFIVIDAIHCIEYMGKKRVAFYMAAHVCDVVFFLV